MPQYTAEYVTTIKLLDYPDEHPFFEDGLPNGERANIEDLRPCGIITIRDEHTSLPGSTIPRHRYEFKSPSFDEAKEIAEKRAQLIQAHFPIYRSPITVFSFREYQKA